MSKASMVFAFTPQTVPLTVVTLAETPSLSLCTVTSMAQLPERPTLD